MAVKPRWTNLTYGLIALLALVSLQAWWAQAQLVEAVPYSEIESALAADRVGRVVVGDRRVVAYLKTPDASGKQVLTANLVEPGVAERLARYKVPYSREFNTGWLTQLVSWIAPALVFAGIWFLFFRRMADRQGAGGLMSIGKSRAKVMLERNTGVTFADVAGVDEAKEELKEVVDFLKQPVEYGRLGAHIPKGVLLVGPPGTGKTLLARALAGEAGVAFLSTNGAEFVEMFVGVGAARVRDLFEDARRNAPAIVFIDELDAVGRARGSFGLGGHDDKEQTLNQLLAEMDGFDPSAGVIILAATNRPEILDAALLRAGRFDRQILVDRPDRKGRLAVLQVHARKVKLAPTVSLDEIAAMTPGFAGADLANLVNEAALLATRRGADAVEGADLTAAFERIVAGLEKKSRVLSPRERAVVAHHEMGHALVAMTLDPADPVRRISIIPRGIGALGYTLQRPTEDRFLRGQAEMEAKLAVLLAGRAAELLVFGEPSTGAADDLAKATDIARAMAMRYGMQASLGLAVYDVDPSPLVPVAFGVHPDRRYGEATAREIDNAVRSVLGDALERATGVLRGAREVLDRGAKQLLERETLDEGELGGLRQQLPGVIAGRGGAVVDRGEAPAPR